MTRASSDITIDRLVLDIPGVTPARAASLAQDIGERLAMCGLTGSGLTGDFARVSVTLASGDDAELAQRIVAALMERLT
jgi:hypothetical protein